jgi:hypothetical protein
MLIYDKCPEPQRRQNVGRTEMEWEEALLRAWGGEVTPQSAAYYRRNAVRAQQAAEGVTTRALKTRPLDEAVQCDQLAVDAELVAGQAADS